MIKPVTSLNSWTELLEITGIRFLDLREENDLNSKLPACTLIFVSIEKAGSKTMSPVNSKYAEITLAFDDCYKCYQKVEYILFYQYLNYLSYISK